MHVQRKQLPVVQVPPSINKHAGDSRSQLNLLMASTKHTVCQNEIRLEAIAISVRYKSHSYSPAMTNNSFPIGTFVDIYA